MSRGVRTEWHLAELATADPFDGVAYSGIEINLDASEADLTAHLQRLLKREARLFDSGVMCELKDSGQDCRTCPMATLDQAEPRSALCRVGKDEHFISERISDRRAPVREMGEKIGDWSELGHLDGEVIELLTAVGL